MKKKYPEKHFRPSTLRNSQSRQRRYTDLFSGRDRQFTDHFTTVTPSFANQDFQSFLSFGFLRFSLYFFPLFQLSYLTIFFDLTIFKNPDFLFLSSSLCESFFPYRLSLPPSLPNFSCLEPCEEEKKREKHETLRFDFFGVLHLFLDCFMGKFIR